MILFFIRNEKKVDNSFVFERKVLLLSRELNF